MALSGIWITVVSVLAIFDITKAVDEKGNVIEPAYEYIPGGIPSEAYLCVAPIMSPNYSLSTPVQMLDHTAIAGDSCAYSGSSRERLTSLTEKGRQVVDVRFSQGRRRDIGAHSWEFVCSDDV
jgi:hypothetical protein